MPDIKREAIVAYTPAEMYDLVDAIERYPEFLTWCVGSEIISRDEDAVCASLTVSGAGLQKTFTTRNRLQKHKMIELRLVNGPFKHLEGLWRFDKHDTGSKVAFDLEFEFAGMLIDFAFGPIFHQMANSLVDAFILRAQAIYGKR